MAKGVESSLLGEQLLVGHRVDVGGEAERRTTGDGGGRGEERTGTRSFRWLC